jgi:hypothetical protein
LRSVAYILSVIFHPIFVPIYLFLLLTEIEPVMSLYFTDDIRWRFAASLVVTTVLGPALSMYVMKKRGLIKDLEMSELRGRSVIFLITAFYYVFTYVMLKDIEMPRVIHGLFIGMMLTLVLMALISLRFKISAHLAAMGGACGVLTWVFVNYGVWESSWVITLSFLAGLIASARLYLQAHTLPEVGAGFALGILSIFGSLYVLI